MRFLLKIAPIAALVALSGCGLQGTLGGSGALPGLVTGLTGLPGSTASAIILQEAQDVRNVELGLAAIAQSPATVMVPTPVTVMPVPGTPLTPPVVVMPAPTTPLPAPAPVPSTGPVVTPN